jgi:hypothetical protein
MKFIRAFVVASTLLLASGMLAQTPSQGDHKVRQYQKKNGTVVKPHYQTNPNKTQKDNYSSKGRVNPHTGKSGTKTPKY